MEINGTKHDGEKAQMDLLCFTALEKLSDVLTFGANKYARHNWTRGINNSRIVSSLLRHLSAYQRGEDIDSESGLPHVHHISCNAMFLGSNYELRKHLDDRVSSNGSKLNDVSSSVVPKGFSNSYDTEDCLSKVVYQWGVQA